MFLGHQIILAIAQIHRNLLLLLFRSPLRLFLAIPLRFVVNLVLCRSLLGFAGPPVPNVGLLLVRLRRLGLPNANPYRSVDSMNPLLLASRPPRPLRLLYPFCSPTVFWLLLQLSPHHYLWFLFRRMGTIVCLRLCPSRSMIPLGGLTRVFLFLLWRTLVRPYLRRLRVGQMFLCAFLLIAESDSTFAGAIPLGSILPICTRSFLP